MNSEPWFIKLIPDIRGWIALGYFALGDRLLWMVDNNAALLNSAPFIGLTTLVLGTGGLGTIVLFFFGGTKGGTDAMTKQTASMIKSAEASTAASTTNGNGHA